MKVRFAECIALAIALCLGCGGSDGASPAEDDDDDRGGVSDDDSSDDDSDDDSSADDDDDDDSSGDDDEGDDQPRARIDAGSEKDASSGPARPRADAARTPVEAGTTPAEPANDAATSAGGGPAVPGTNCLKGMGDYTANGPYKVKKRDVTIGSQGPYTIFSPDPLESSCPHPIVAWGNGTGVTGSNVYAFFNEHAASWGIVVIASHNSNTGSGMFHTAGLDYLLAENEKAGSEFFGKLSKVAGTSGHSQGGGGANAGARHPNVKAVDNVQGAFGAAPGNAAFLCLTGTADIATQGCKTAVQGAKMPALYANWDGGDHTTTPTLGGFISNNPGTKQYMRLYTSWFRCFLANDENACAMFKGGEDCPVCKDPGWAEIFTKNY